MEGNSVCFSRKSDEWATPQDLFDKLNSRYHFLCDVCASDENHKLNWYFTKKVNGLSADWPSSCWCNPPYSNIATWVRKAYEESCKGSLVVMLIPSRTDTRWFHKYIYKREGVVIEFIKGRLKFNNSKWNAPFPSMIVVFNVKEAINDLQQKLF